MEEIVCQKICSLFNRSNQDIAIHITDIANKRSGSTVFYR